nr:Imm51 family immunity protein [Micromonospora sp. DSM 115978]
MVSDSGSYAPFRLIGDETYDGLVLVDGEMEGRIHVFEERSDEGWAGNGYDWTSVARVLVTETFPQYERELVYDPEAGMFFVRGPREVLEEIAAELTKVYHDESRLRDLLSRAELD